MGLIFRHQEEALWGPHRGIRSNDDRLRMGRPEALSMARGRHGILSSRVVVTEDQADGLRAHAAAFPTQW